MQSSNDREAQTSGLYLGRRGLIVGSLAAATLSSLTAIALPTTAAFAAGGYVYPTNPYRPGTLPGQLYGAYRSPTRLHAGLDIEGAAGASIMSIAAGQIVGGSWSISGAYGYYVDVTHDDGNWSRYAHFAAPPQVAQGTRVAAGQQLGVMGGSGFGSLTYYGRHLHLEIREGGLWTDPKQFLANRVGGAAPAPTPSIGDEDMARFLAANSADTYKGRSVTANTWALIEGGAFTRIVNPEELEALASSLGVPRSSLDQQVRVVTGRSYLITESVYLRMMA